MHILIGVAAKPHPLRCCQSKFKVAARVEWPSNFKPIAGAIPIVSFKYLSSKSTVVDLQFRSLSDAMHVEFKSI